jgi:hypothetical protein
MFDDELLSVITPDSPLKPFIFPSSFTVQVQRCRFARFAGAHVKMDRLSRMIDFEHPLLELQAYTYTGRVLSCIGVCVESGILYQYGSTWVRMLLRPLVGTGRDHLIGVTMRYFSLGTFLPWRALRPRITT